MTSGKGFIKGKSTSDYEERFPGLLSQEQFSPLLKVDMSILS